MNRHQRAKWYRIKQNLPNFWELLAFIVGFVLFLLLVGFAGRNLPLNMV